MDINTLVVSLCNYELQEIYEKKNFMFKDLNLKDKYLYLMIKKIDSFELESTKTARQVLGILVR